MQCLLQLLRANYIELYRTISNYVELYRTISNFIELYRTMSNYVESRFRFCLISFFLLSRVALSMQGF